MPGGGGGTRGLWLSLSSNQLMEVGGRRRKRTGNTCRCRIISWSSSLRKCFYDENHNMDQITFHHIDNHGNTIGTKSFQHLNFNFSGSPRKYSPPCWPLSRTRYASLLPGKCSSRTEYQVVVTKKVPSCVTFCFDLSGRKPDFWKTLWFRWHNDNKSSVEKSHVMVKITTSYVKTFPQLVSSQTWTSVMWNGIPSWATPPGAWIKFLIFGSVFWSDWVWTVLIGFDHLNGFA